MSGSISGFDEVMRNLNSQINGISNRSMAGLMEAGLKIEALSKERVPREHGNLYGSFYTRRAQDGSLSVEIGNSAAYAAAVHENLEQKLAGEARPSGLGVYWGPQGEPKFLERTVSENVQNIVAIVQHHASVGE